MNRRILIVGAGPTGLAAATELARRGIIADVIDKKERASKLSRAVGILPRSLEILKPSGVTDRLLAEAVKLSQVSIFNGAKESLSLHLSGGHPNWDFVLALAQDRTEGILRDAFESLGGEINFGSRLAELEEDKDGVRVSIEGHGERTYDLVLGADGIRSTVRESIGLEFPGFDLTETWSIADVDASRWAYADRFVLSILSDGEIVVVAPLDTNRFRVISNTANSLVTLPLPMDVANVRREGTFNISIRQVETYNVGRVYLAGDAAHCHSPAGGRGMNLGIADAAEFAECVFSDSLGGYSESRRIEGHKTIEASERIRRLATRKDPFGRLGIRLGLSAVKLFPPLRTRIVRTFLGDV